MFVVGRNKSCAKRCKTENGPGLLHALVVHPLTVQIAVKANLNGSGIGLLCSVSIVVHLSHKYLCVKNLILSRTNYKRP